jgi:hypothetical protein
VSTWLGHAQLGLGAHAPLEPHGALVDDHRDVVDVEVGVLGEAVADELRSSSSSRSSMLLKSS